MMVLGRYPQEYALCLLPLVQPCLDQAGAEELEDHVPCQAWAEEAAEEASRKVGINAQFGNEVGRGVESMDLGNGKMEGVW
jgi:hypothetical protein